MKILAITSDGYGAPIALNLKREGSEVKFFIKEPNAREIYKGILDSVPDWRPHLAWCDYVCFLNNGLSDIWKECVKVKPCFGGSEAGQKLEKDRPFAHQIVKSVGIKCPESTEVKTIPELEKHLKEHQIKHVVKFVGGNTDSDDVMLGYYEDNKDLLRFCKQMESSGKKWDSIEIEEKIDGVEAGCAGYFDGNKFAPGIEINFQFKPFAVGNRGDGIGFLTGEMGTMTKMVDESNPFFKRTIAKLADYLKSVDYRGEFDMGFIVNESGDYFIEDTSRKGYPDCVIRLENQKTPESDLYFQIAKGNVTKNEYLPVWSMGIVVVSPGFPDTKSSDKRSVGLPIFGYEENIGHCHLFEAKKGPDGYEISKGGYGYPLVVTGKGNTIEEAIKNTYWLLDLRNPNSVYVPKAWYRSDIGERLLRSKERIIKLGILTREEFDGKDNGPSDENSLRPNGEIISKETTSA